MVYKWESSSVWIKAMWAQSQDPKLGSWHSGFSPRDTPLVLLRLAEGERRVQGGEKNSAKSIEKICDYLDDTGKSLKIQRSWKSTAVHRCSVIWEGEIAQIPPRSPAQVCSFRLHAAACLFPYALHFGGWRKQAYKNTRKNTLECTVSLRAFGIRSAVAFEPALWYDEIS